MIKYNQYDNSFSNFKGDYMKIKKRLLILCFIISVLFIGACTQNKPLNEPETQIEEPSEPIETPELPVESDPTEVLTNTLVSIDQNTLESKVITNGFEFSLYAMTHISLIKDKYFYIDFKEIIYQPMLNEICIRFDYHDEDYEQATYYMIGLEKGTHRTLQQLSYIKSNQEGEHGGCFNFMLKETTYQILIGKRDLDDLNPSSSIEPVAIIEFIDHNYHERHKVGSMNLSYDPSTTYTYDSIPYVSLDMTIDDPHEIINQVVLELYEPETNLLLQTYTIEINYLKWNNEKLIIENYAIPNLAPHTDYHIKVYISGHNGIEPFTNVHVLNSYFTSQSITYNNGFRKHGFFAVVTDIKPLDTVTMITYISVNTGRIVSAIDQQPYSFILQVFNDENQLIYHRPLDETVDMLFLPNIYAQIGNKIRIVTDRDDIILTETFIKGPAPRIIVNRIEDGYLYGQVIEGVDSINFITFILFYGTDFIQLDLVEVTTFTQNGSFSIELPNYLSYQHYDQVILFYQIQYGSLSHPSFFSRELWIELS